MVLTVPILLWRGGAVHSAEYRLHVDDHVILFFSRNYHSQTVELMLCHDDE